MASHVTVLGNEGVIYRGSPWKFQLPLTVSVDGTSIDYTSSGSLQFQYRAKGGTGAATRWNSGDGATRFESATLFNYFLIPDDDTFMGTVGDGDTHWDVELDYIDTNSKEHPVGIKGTITVSDRQSGAPA